MGAMMTRNRLVLTLCLVAQLVVGLHAAQEVSCEGGA